jgi:hypothetical protein
LRDNFSVEPLILNPHADSLVEIMNSYIKQNTVEFYVSVELFLEECVAEEFGVTPMIC